MKTTIEIFTDWMLIMTAAGAGVFALGIALYWLLKVLDGCRREKDNQDRIMDRHIMPKRERGEG